jgi:GcrA cell cycle regulator
MSGFNWTPEAFEWAKSMRERGISASKIADALGIVCQNPRSAVLSKFRRAGLSSTDASPEQSARIKAGIAAKRARDGKPPVNYNPKAKPSPNKSVALNDSARAAQIRYSEAAKSGEHIKNFPAAEPGCELADLTNRRCHWPSSMGDEVATHFCGAPTQLGVPYCEEHLKQALTPEGYRRLLAKWREREYRKHSA